jgi:nitronate monooxygenase
VARPRAELAEDPQARAAYQADLASGAIPPLPVWAGEAVDLITDRPDAADLVETIALQAEAVLTSLTTTGFRT